MSASATSGPIDAATPDILVMNIQALLSYVNVVFRFNKDVTNIPELIAACKKDKMVEKFVGLHYLKEYRSYEPGDLANFVYLINELPQMAKYVKSIFLDATLDGSSFSNVYDMLISIFNTTIGNKSEIVNPNFAGTTSYSLLNWADEFYLATFGDTYNVPKRIYFATLSQLFSELDNVTFVCMPESWYRELAIDRIFPKLVDVVSLV